MRLNLKISHKGLILVSVPLICELLFVGLLAHKLQDAEQMLKEEKRNREIVTHMNNLARFAIDATEALVTYKTSKSDADIAQFDEQVRLSLLEYTVLKGKLRNQQDIDEVNKLEKLNAHAAAILDKCKYQLASGDRMAALQYGPRLIAIGHAVNDGFRLMVGPYRQSGEKAQREHEESLKGIWHILLFGIILNVLLAFLLATFFSKGITGRLRTLTDNSLRLAKGQPLHPLLGGSDEIASLDTDFHKMAAELETAMQELRASEERTRLVIEHMPVGVLTVDSSGKIESINPRTETIFACASSDLVGKQFAAMLPGIESAQNAPESLSHLQVAIGKTVDSEAQRAGGEKFPCEISINRFQTKDGDRFLVNLQDVTERHEIERLKQEFVAMVSHDLRTPLTAVQGTLTLLQEGTYGELSETGVKRVEVAEQSIDRLINLINDLLDIEKLEAGKLTMKLESVPVSAVIEHSVEAVRGFAEQHKVTVTAEPVDINVMADEDRLVQVLVNLLSNAVKFSPQHSVVTVSASKSEPYVELKVTDCGRGVPPEFREAVFERFKQVAATDGKRKKGTGLGLAICKAIVEAHGGQIGVDSEEGKGSTFWVRLPA